MGNEFAPVESLWSHFENVMAKDTNENAGHGQGQGDGEGQTDVGEETEVTEHAR